MNTPSTLLHALALAATLASPMAQAADATYNDEAAFVAAIQGGPGVPIIEGFESLEPRLRSLQPLSSPWFTLSSETTPMGVQDGSNSPEDGYGSYATEGTQYLSVYRTGGLPQGTLQFDMNTPGHLFGFSITDVGEVEGTVHLRTDSGAYAGGVDVAVFPPVFGNGQQFFFGLTQDTPFTQVWLTVNGVDEAYGLDKLYVTLTPVPEPAAAWLLLAGGAALALRRRRKASAAR
jgi:hypothetical protein